MPSRTGGGAGTIYTAEDQANELLGTEVLPPPSIASGYASPAPAPAPAPVQEAAPAPAPTPTTQGYDQVYVAGNVGSQAPQPVPAASSFTPPPEPSAAPYTGPNYLSEPQSGDLATMPSLRGYGGPSLQQFGGRQVQPATPPDPYVDTLPRTGNPGFLPTPTPFSPTMGRRADVVTQTGGDTQAFLRNLYGPNPTQDPALATALTQQAPPPTLDTPPVTLDPARPNTQGQGTLVIPTVGGNPDWSWTQGMDQPVVDPNLFPQSMQDEVIGSEPWRPEQYQWDPASSQANGGWDIAGTALRGIVDPIASGVGGAFATTNDRLVAQDERLAAQRETQDARNAASAAAAVGAPGGLVDAQPPAPTIMGPGGAGTGQPPLTPSWNIPQNARDAISEAIAAPFAAYGENRSDIMTLPAGSQGTPRTTPDSQVESTRDVTGPLAGDVPSTRILNPDMTLSQRDAPFASGELFPDDTFTAADGTQATMGSFFTVAQDADGNPNLVRVTPAPGTTSAIKEAGGDIWQLDDAEFDTLVAAGLIDEADRAALVGKPLAISKEWVDALGGNTTYDLAAAPPPVDTSSSGSGSSRSSGGGGGGRGGGSGRSGGYGGGGGYFGDAGFDPAAFFGPDFMGGRFAAEGDGGRDAPFDSPIFDRYFATLNGRFPGFGRRRRGRRGRTTFSRNGNTGRGASMPEMNVTMRRGGGDSTSSNLDRARKLQER